MYVADLKKIQPLGGTPLDVSSGPFTINQSIRKSFSRAERPVCLKNKSTLDVKTIEESTSGTDPEEESAGADITNLTDYNEIFKGRKDRELLLSVWKYLSDKRKRLFCSSENAST